MYKEQLGTGNWTDNFDKNSLAYKKNQEDSSRKDSLAGISANVDAVISSQSSSASELERLVTAQKNLSESSYVYMGNQRKINKLVEEEESYRLKLNDYEDQLVIKQGEYLNNIQLAQEMIDSGVLGKADLEVAKKEVEYWNKAYSDIVKEIEKIQKATGTYTFGDKGTVSDKFNRLSDQELNSFTSEELSIIANLDIDSDSSVDEIKSALEKVQAVADEEPIEVSITTASDAIKMLSELEDSMSSLDSAYAELLDTEDGKIDLSNLEGIRASFEEIEGFDLSSISSYLQALSDASSVEEAQKAMDSLASTYIEQSGILDNINDSNKNVIAQQLKSIGISNAEEIVTERLVQRQKELAAEKYVNSNASVVLNNTIIDEISAIEAEAESAGISVAELAKLELAKISVNDVKINTDSDIDNIIAIANAAGASVQALNRLKQAKELLTSGDSQQQRWASETLDKLSSGNYDFEIDSNKYKAKTNKAKTSYSGGSASQKQIEQNAKSAKDEWAETFDFFEQRIKNISDAVSLLNTQMENVSGAFNKNRLVEGQYNLTQNLISENEKMLAAYSSKAQELLSAVPASLRNAAVYGADAIIDMVGDSNKEVLEAIQNYQEWANKASDVRIEIAELTTKLRELAKQKFDNIANDFVEQFDIIKNTISTIEKQISFTEESGIFVGQAYYQELITQAGKQLEILSSKKSQLAAELSSALSSGKIQAGTEEWVEMVNTLQELDSEILDAKTDIEKFNNSIQDLHWEVFEKITDQFENLATELENIIDVISDESAFNTDGSWSDEGITKLALYAQQYELASYSSQQYAKEIDELQSAYSRGEYSALEYAEKLAELNQAQWDSIDNAEAAKDAIVALNEARVEAATDAIQKEIDAYEELTQAQIDNLDAQKDLYEWQRSLEDKTASVESIQKQLAAMANDNTAETIAKRKKLEAELAEAQQELNDALYEHNIDSQKDALDKSLDDYTKAKNKEIEDLKATLTNEEALIAASLELIKNNTSVVSQQLTEIAQRYGIEISTTITDAWTSGSNAIGSYSDTLTSYGSVFKSQLAQTQNSIYALATESNNSARALANMYATSGQNLMNTLLSGRASLSNTTLATNTLQSALSSTLSSGYDTSGITSALNSIKDAANDAASAIRNMLNASGENNYKILINGQAVTDFMTKTQAEDWLKKNNSSGYYYMAKYAQGGVLGGSSSSNKSLDALARSMGEDHITTIAYKDDERILSQEQNKSWEKLTDLLPSVLPTLSELRGINLDKVNFEKIGNSISSNTPIVSNVSVNVAGDITERSLAKMAEIAKQKTEEGITKTFEKLQFSAYKKGVR